MSDHHDHQRPGDDDERWEHLETLILELVARELGTIHTQIQQLHKGQTTIMATLDDLNAAITQLSIDLGEAVTRIEAKIAAGNPDLQPEVDAIRAASATLDALAADPPVA